MERIKEIEEQIWKRAVDLTVDKIKGREQEQIDTEKSIILDQASQEITTYIIGEVSKLKRLGAFVDGFHIPDVGANDYNQALDDVEKMLKGDK